MFRVRTLNVLLATLVMAGSNTSAPAQGPPTAPVLPFPATTPETAVAPPEVKALIKQLADKDEAVRLKAAKDLGKMKEKAKAAIPALKTATTDTDEDVREVAKKALAAVQGGADKAVPVKVDAELEATVKGLRSKDAKTRLAAIAKLAEMGEKAKPAGAVLVEVGVMSTHLPTRDAATTAFEKIDAVVCKEVLTILYDESPEPKGRAIDKLRELGPDAKSALPAMIKYTASSYSASSLSNTSLLEALISVAPEESQVHQIIFAIVGGPENLLPVVPAFGGRVIGSRKLAVQMMNKLTNASDRDKLAALAAALVRCYTNDELEMLLTEIGELEVEKKVKCRALMNAVSNTTWRGKRGPIIEAIGSLGADAKDALPTLKSLKTDKEEAVRDAAAAAVEAISSGKPLIPPVKKPLADDGKPGPGGLGAPGGGRGGR